MAIFSSDDLLKQIQQRQFQPVYFLQGDEPYFIDTVADALESSVLPESERSFNQTVLYGKDTDAAGILGQAKRFPMMSAHSVVIVKEAQAVAGWDLWSGSWKKLLQNPGDKAAHETPLQKGDDAVLSFRVPATARLRLVTSFPLEEFVFLKKVAKAAAKITLMGIFASFGTCAAIHSARHSPPEPTHGLRAAAKARGLLSNP